MEVHDRFDQQTNLDEREKMRAHTHLSRLQTPVFAVVLGRWMVFAKHTVVLCQAEER